MCRIDVLLNEKAGSTDGDSRRRISEAFAKTAVEARVLALGGDRLAAAAQEAAREHRVLVAAGGDGTVSAVAAVAADAGAVFGVIPLGTLNHFAKDAGIPLDLQAAVDAIAAGRVDPIDIAMANGRAFVNNVSAGFYARAVRERQIEQRHGHAKWTRSRWGCVAPGSTSVR